MANDRGIWYPSRDRGIGIGFAGLQLTAHADAPTDSGLAKGRVYMDTDGNLYVYDGSSWVDLTLGAGASSDSFKTINCPAGTDPVAESATDTLNLTAGTGLAITGTAGTDTIAFALSLGAIDHDSLLNYAANEHVALPGTTANVISDMLDEDNMTSDSAVKVASQQSIKAYVDTHRLGVLADTLIWIGDGSGDSQPQTIGGDMTLANDGTLSFVAGIIVNADINAGAAIVESKLLFDNAGHGHSGGADGKLVSVGNATQIENNCVLNDAGALTTTLVLTTQTVTGASLVIPDFAAALAATVAFTNFAQAYTAAQTFGNTYLHLLDSNAAHDLIIITDDDTPIDADRTLSLDMNNANRRIDIAGDVTLAGALTTTGAWLQTGAHSFTLNTGGNLVFTSAGAGTVTFATGSWSVAAIDGALGSAGITGGTAIELTALSIRDSVAAFDVILASTSTGLDADRTITIDCNNAAATIDLNGNVSFGGTASFAGAMSFAGAWTHTGAHTVGITTQNNGTLAFADATAYALTLPTGTDTIVGRASTDILTNKSFDCDGTGNALTNVNADELDPVTPGVGIYGTHFVIAQPLTNLPAAGTNIFVDNAPFKFRVIKVWSVATSANGGTWALNKGKVGALGNAITNTVTVAAVDTDIDEATKIDDTEHEIAQNGSLVVVGDGNGALDIIIYVECMKVD